MALPPVDPPPPRAPGRIPWLGAGLGLLRDPTAFFTTTRQRLGDTFLLDAFGYRLFCVFSPAGVRSLYALPEHVASKGLADLALLAHKLPGELLRGRRARPHDLFGGEEVESYLAAVEEAVDRQLAELDGDGTLDAFRFAHRLGQRIGLACWAGREASSPPYFERLLPWLARLDASDAFVRPASAITAWATGKRRERTALRGIEATVNEIVVARRQLPRAGDFLDRIIDTWADDPETSRTAGIARDVVMLHMGSQSNLPAALGWTLVNVVRRPALLDEVRAGDDALLERCASESIRRAQRSITLRAIRAPVTIDDGQRTYQLAPGVLLATMLPVTNTTAAPGLEEFDPGRWDGRRLIEPDGLAARELVSTFGHGRHACPAQRFSISAIRIALRRLIDGFDLEPRFERATPARRQLGGVARPDEDCPVRYRRRALPRPA
jgi:cytochrome P450